MLSLFHFQGVFSQIDTNIYQVDTSLELSSPLKGNIRTIEWISESLNELRKISIYEPIHFNKDSTYDLVILTDNMCLEVASILEMEMIEHRMRPILIVGIHNREKQPIDSILKGYDIDFRMKEMIGDMWLTPNMPIRNDSSASLLFKNRHQNYMNWVSKEVIEYLETIYHLSSQKHWTLGGFSNGGFVVLKINSSIPGSFGNIISMSPAMIDFELTKTESRYFLCAGTEEPYYYAKSLEIAEFFQKHNMEFEHRTYLSGHNRNMWRNYYFDCLTKIYQN